jgi:hypothetical protein
MHRTLRLPAVDEEKADVHMERLVPNIARDLGNQHATFCLAPTKHLADEAECVRFDAQSHVFALISADFFHARVFGPWTDWDLKLPASAKDVQGIHIVCTVRMPLEALQGAHLHNLLLHIHKSSGFHSRL